MLRAVHLIGGDRALKQHDLVYVDLDGTLGTFASWSVHPGRDGRRAPPRAPEALVPRGGARPRRPLPWRPLLLLPMRKGMEMLDTVILLLRIATVVAGLWLIVECWRTVRPAQPSLTHKGRMTYMVWIGWGFVCAYGLSEQIVTEAPNGFRTIGTLSILLVSVYTVRLPGGTRQEPLER